MKRSEKLLLLVLLLFLAAALPGAAGCGGSGGTGRAYAEPADHVDPRLVRGNTAFGLGLFRRLLEEDPGENLFISPASVSLALAMTLNGADGETFAAMADTLGLEGMSLAEINDAFADLKTILQNPDPKVTLTVANSLWARAGITFDEDFLKRNRRYYGAAVTELDFDLPGAAGEINGWVKENTGGKIEEIVESPIDPRTVLFLINAIYFKGEWTEQFDPEKTEAISFALADGTQKQHPVMFRDGEFRYLAREGFQAVWLPYGKNERVGMYVFLPAPDSSLEEFYASLTAENWTRWLDSFTVQSGEIGLPRFKFDYEASLKSALETLGMVEAFNPAAADFGAMRPERDLYINEVKHKTFVEVNEEGTEAAAATSVEIRLTALPQGFSMIVDRPFCFAIADSKTGSLLFIGSVTDPV